MKKKLATCQDCLEYSMDTVRLTLNSSGENTSEKRSTRRTLATAMTALTLLTPRVPSLNRTIPTKVWGLSKEVDMMEAKHDPSPTPWGRFSLSP